jgi:SAM-dependent methyltransferase
MEEHCDLLTKDLKLLEIAPWPSLSRRFQKMPNIRFTGLDIKRTGPHVTVVGNATRIPINSNTFDAALCIHVLEHIEDDRAAIDELYRILKPGGWAVVSVPLRLEQPTHEDPLITDPEERARVFGERGHVRFYGIDLVDRLQAAGLTVQLDLAGNVPPAARKRFGLRDDENIFRCHKPSDTIQKPAV